MTSHASTRRVIQCACERTAVYHGHSDAIEAGWRCVGGAWHCPEHRPPAPVVTEADLAGPQAWRVVEAAAEVDPVRGATLAFALYSAATPRTRKYIAAWARSALGVDVADGRMQQP